MQFFSYTGIGLIVTIFLIIMAIVWFFLPFAIFGTKELIQELINETKKNNTLLEKIANELKNDSAI